MIPYAALIYDDAGETFTYVSAKPLRYVAHADRGRSGSTATRPARARPAARHRVVTVGAAEVYSAEFGVED